jgi:hypothetical protein
MACDKALDHCFCSTNSSYISGVAELVSAQARFSKREVVYVPTAEFRDARRGTRETASMTPRVVCLFFWIQSVPMERSEMRLLQDWRIRGTCLVIWGMVLRFRGLPGQEVTSLASLVTVLVMRSRTRVTSL